MKESILFIKSKAFAIKIVYLYKYLVDEKREFILSKQLLRSGTSVGANIREARFAQSMPDFISKMSIALKEISETQYWLELLMETEYLGKAEAENIIEECTELTRMLHATVKTSKQNNK
ncbi:four helix bundle protein [Tissierella sp. P1]|uniref:four helix bundle protein n=1 Tax=Tissierella sp. P1 TaxID=1280483 RepID=UPI000BA0ECEC|nr:four helix bundle protein [Tissierella sp. P1]OZV12662.1 four helix bundle protein [Tissierella sp. P1]